MQTDLLFDQFDTLLTTPDDVAHLEAAVLQLAVRGKLVPQDPDDEPAPKLFECILVEKERLVREGQVRKPKPLPPIKAAEIPYGLPTSWVWCRLEDLFLSVSTRGKQLKTKEYQEAGKFAVIGQGQEYITAYSDRTDRLIRINHPLIVFGDHTREVKYVDFDFIAGADGTKVLDPFQPICEKFFYYVLRSYKIESRGYARHYKKLVARLFPLPPLAEQKRIVAKIEHLLAQTRALAAQLEQVDAALVPAAQAAFQSLLEAQDTTTQNEAGQRIADHFDTLTSDPRTIEALKQTVLQLAVQGKLVPQDPDDEPVTELLKRIKTEKERLIREGEIRKAKQLPPIETDEVPFELRTGWVWARLGDVFDLEYGKGLPKKKRESHGEVPVYGSNGIVGYHAQSLVDSACVVIGRKGSSGAVNLALRPSWVIDTAYFVRPPAEIDLVYTFHLLKSLSLETLGKGIKPGLNRNEAYNLVVAIPPLAEQKRIVAKVESLLALCDALAAEVAAVEEVRARLLQAVLNGG